MPNSTAKKNTCKTYNFIPKGWKLFFPLLVIQKLLFVTDSTDECFKCLQEGATKVNEWSHTAEILYNLVIAPAVKPAVVAPPKLFMDTVKSAEHATTSAKF